MNIIRWTNNPVWNTMGDFDKFQEELNKFFDLDFGRRFSGVFDGTVSPAIDLVEYEDRFELTSELPGLDPKSLDINVASNVLTIKGEKSDNLEGKEVKFYRRESWSGSFQRTLALPKTVDAEGIEATMKDGILTVRLPKRPEEKPKMISVKVK